MLSPVLMGMRRKVRKECHAWVLSLLMLIFLWTDVLKYKFTTWLAIIHNPTNKCIFILVPFSLVVPIFTCR